MATEQDALLYTAQAYLEETDFLLGPKAGGAGIRAAGSAFLAKRSASGPFTGSGAVLLGQGGAINTETAPSYAGLWIAFDGGSNLSILQAVNASSAGFAFHTKSGSGSAPAEACRITGAREFLVATTGMPAPTDATGSGWGVNSGAVMVQKLASNNSPRYVNKTAWVSGTTYFDAFNVNGTTVGSVSSNGSSTAYNTSSDHRLKDDYQPLTGALDRILALPVYDFLWIASGLRARGFKAHEFGEAIPGAATGEKDGMRWEEYEVEPARPSSVLGPDGAPVMIPAVMGKREVPDYQGIDQSKAVPDLVAAVQELHAIVKAQAERIAVLEAAA